MKTAGAAYLIALGLQSLWVGRGRPPPVVGRGTPTPRWARPGAGWAFRRWPGRGLRQGVVSNLANPKMAAFFPEPAAAVRLRRRAGPVGSWGWGWCSA